eukprot:TRINITY_DN2607_c6_g1_i1.p1 TRINITY_DN2607_c6_g1~~TRINITY_DN2607_c6_g1_i1.p1  ORF type:complete len:177 (+),score=27.52 TRINITY_DN2607_c6_g1_i1:75-605(+)
MFDLEAELLDMPPLAFDESDLSNSEEWLREGSSVSGGSEKLRLYARGDCSAPETVTTAVVERKRIPLPKPTHQKKRRGKRGKRNQHAPGGNHSAWNREISTSSEEISDGSAFNFAMSASVPQLHSRIPLPDYSDKPVQQPEQPMPLPKAGRIPLPSQMSAFHSTGMNIKTGLVVKS